MDFQLYKNESCNVILNILHKNNINVNNVNSKYL